VKDLRCIKDYDLSSIVIVDNSLLSFSLHVDNGIPISNFFNDPQDRELKHLTQYLVTKIAKARDIRTVNRAEFKLNSIIDLSLQH
jgi:TFIIF-interacting CTD phosphatase-like protein